MIVLFVCSGGTGSLLFIVQSLRFPVFPRETEMVLTRTRKRDRKGNAVWGCLIIVEQGRSETKNHELISYQIYMKIAIN